MDWLADKEDVAVLANELPGECIVYQQVSPSYAHLDYTWAMNANTEIYGNVVMLLEKYK